MIIRLQNNLVLSTKGGIFMKFLKTWNFFEATQTGDGTPLILYSESAGGLLDLQFYSDAVITFEAKIQAKLFDEAGWEDIAVSNNATLAVGVPVTTLGLYTCAVGAYRGVRVTVSVLSGGKLTVKGKVYN
jgi:hypothetical protein